MGWRGYQSDDASYNVKYRRGLIIGDEILPVHQKVSVRCICIHSPDICELLEPENIVFHFDI